MTHSPAEKKRYGAEKKDMIFCSEKKKKKKKKKWPIHQRKKKDTARKKRENKNFEWENQFSACIIRKIF